MGCRQIATYGQYGMLPSKLHIVRTFCSKVSTHLKNVRTYWNKSCGHNGIQGHFETMNMDMYNGTCGYHGLKIADTLGFVDILGQKLWIYWDLRM